MGIDAGRRAFLRGGIPKTSPIRPPWSVAEAAFVAACDRCGDCLCACPEGVLARGDGGYPETVFRRRGCSFCGDCVRACPRPAFDRQAFAAALPAWAAVATVAAGCLLHAGVECRSCGDHCAPAAIRFRPVPGGRVRLMLDAAACTGCGACVGPCPAGAIVVSIPVEG